MVLRVLSDDEVKSQSSAMLAQELASNGSWADRFVTAPTSDGPLPVPGRYTPEASVQGEEPPTYEQTVSEDSRSGPPPAPYEQAVATYQRPRTPLGGRKYKRHENFSSISGRYDVHDKLVLSTGTGSINVTLNVMPYDYPAVVKIESKTGSVTVRDERYVEDPSSGTISGLVSGVSQTMSGWLGASSGSCSSQQQPPRTSIPTDPNKQPGQHLTSNQDTAVDEVDETEQMRRMRPVHVQISSRTGSVTAYLLLVPHTQIDMDVSTGSLTLKMATASTSNAEQSCVALSKEQKEDSRYAERDLTSTIYTKSKTGSQNITIASDSSSPFETAILGAVRAHHVVRGTAGCSVRYPRNWSGNVQAVCSGTGSANVSGDLETNRLSRREVLGRRGDGSSKITCQVDGTGSCNFYC